MSGTTTAAPISPGVLHASALANYTVLLKTHINFKPVSYSQSQMSSPGFKLRQSKGTYLPEAVLTQAAINVVHRGQAGYVEGLVYRHVTTE